MAMILVIGTMARNGGALKTAAGATPTAKLFFQKILNTTALYKSPLTRLQSTASAVKVPTTRKGPRFVKNGVFCGLIK